MEDLRGLIEQDSLNECSAFVEEDVRGIGKGCLRL